MWSPNFIQQYLQSYTNKRFRQENSLRVLLHWTFSCLQFQALQLRGLGLGETGWLANGAQLQARQSPLPLLLDKNQRYAKLPQNGVAAIGCMLDLTTGQDGCIVVHAHFDLIQVERFVLQVTRAMSSEPLLFGQHETERPYSNEVICKCFLKESGITA